MTQSTVKLFLLTLVLGVVLVPASAAQNKKGSSATESSRSCTDLSGDPVACPERHHAVVLPSPKSGSAELRRCVDLLGNEVPCPGESPAPAEAANDAEVAAPTTGKNPVTAASSSTSSSTSAASQQAVSVVPASSTQTSVAPASGTPSSPCRDLIGQPVSCPVDETTEVAGRGGSGGNSPKTGASTGGSEPDTVSSSSIYTEPANKVQPSLERSLPHNIYEGQKEFWTYPARMRLDDAYWAVPFGITTGGLMAADVSIKNALPQNPKTIKNFKSLSNYGALAYGGLVGGSYVFGKLANKSYLSDTAWLAGEAGLNSFITTYALKYAFGRERPTEGNGQGDFFSGGQSFPSEHSAAVWSVATVFAGRYPGTIPKVAMFGSAALISFSRVAGQQHFMSDAFVGSALGFYYGRQALKRYQREHATDAMYGTFISEKPSPSRIASNMGSPYVPLDSWVYPVFDRLEATGQISTAFLGMRPWTRMECARLLDEYQNRSAVTGVDLPSSPDYRLLANEFADELARRRGEANVGAEIKSVYARIMGIGGQPLRDGYHFAQTITNDYGRPYGEGVNAAVGTSVQAVAGPFTAYFRGEYQRSGFVPPYTPAQQQAIETADLGGAVPPANSFPRVSRGRVVEAYVGFAFKNFQLSAGQQSLWWGPPRGGSMLFTNNAEPIPMVLFSSSSPTKLPGLGPMRFQFFVGKLRGHQYITSQDGVNGPLILFGPDLQDQPYIQGQKIAFKPTPNFEFSVGRTGIFGGPLVPFTSHTFFKSLLATNNTVVGEAPGYVDDPGDRRSSFDFSYRVPKLRDWLTVYLDSMTDDEVSPLGFPRRSAMNPGFYIPQLPKFHKLDFRAEGVYTNLPGLVNRGFFYSNYKFRNGYTNYLDLMASWIGRQGSGWQAWSTYTFSPQRTLQFGYRAGRVDKSFLEGGTYTDFNVKGDFFVRQDLSLSSFFQYEAWKFPLLADGPRQNVTASFQVTFWPKWKVK